MELDDLKHAWKETNEPKKSAEELIAQLQGRSSPGIKEAETSVFLWK